MIPNKKHCLLNISGLLNKRGEGWWLRTRVRRELHDFWEQHHCIFNRYNCTCYVIQCRRGWWRGGVLSSNFWNLCVDSFDWLLPWRGVNSLHPELSSSKFDAAHSHSHSGGLCSSFPQTDASVWHARVEYSLREALHLFSLSTSHLLEAWNPNKRTGLSQHDIRWNESCRAAIKKKDKLWPSASVTCERAWYFLCHR